VVDAAGDPNNYPDTDLTIGTKYIYRVEYKAGGGKTLYYSEDTVHGYTGFVRTPSVPSLSISLVGTPTYGTPAVTRNYYTVTGTAVRNAQIISQSRTQNPSTGVWTNWGSGGGISTTVTSYIPLANTTDNLKWGTGAGAVDTGVVPNSDYFYFVAPTAVANTEFRLVLVNNADAASYTPLVTLP
jgi:hypothetical protein